MRFSQASETRMSQPSLPPAMLLRSFLTVASGYVMTVLSLFSTFLLLGYLLFPSFVNFLSLAPEEQEKIMASDPWFAIPIPMFCLAVVLNCVLCAMIGWLVVRTAPFAFSRMQSLLLFWCLSCICKQSSRTLPQRKQWHSYICFAFRQACWSALKLQPIDWSIQLLNIKLVELPTFDSSCKI